ncbi:uncharacterized protein LOC135701484 [Ochlerotatus camptorhynchus]|uniref:uncharacterized protein LOC135701484 n=1 Tax=Ochlerotatus camptorhynchus TaxID=644619 RepID=UPI0031E4595B
METTVPAPAPKGKKGTKNRKDAAAKDVPKKVYMYDATNEGLPLYGVIVQWDFKTKYSNRALMTKFEPKLAALRPVSEEANKEYSVTKSLKHKMIPFLRHVGPNKGIVMFNDMKQANEFVMVKDPEFSAFIPMSFVSTIGVGVFNKANFKSKEVEQFLPTGYEALQWRKKRLENSKVQVTIAVRGTKLPENLNFRGDTIPFELYERKPVHCTRCLRYGHRTGNCMRKPRCGACTENKPALRHCEKDCNRIKHNKNIKRCLFCGQGHTIGTEGCVEHGQQCEYKMKLVKHKMDYLTVIEKEILPAIRTTAVNSNRIWLD